MIKGVLNYTRWATVRLHTRLYHYTTDIVTHQFWVQTAKALKHKVHTIFTVNTEFYLCAF